jgi:hypothetical protein
MGHNINIESETNAIVLGGVYQTDLDDTPIRVILFDRVQIFYDVWWQDSQDWEVNQSYKSKVIFLRCSQSHFLNTSILVRFESIPDAVINVIRPDLPLYLCRNDKLRWTTKNYTDIQSFAKYLDKAGIDINTLEKLNIDKVILVPFGPKGGDKKGVIVQAANGRYFTGLELLWHAHNVQAVHINIEQEIGMGIYRSGFEKGLPTFYIGGFYDRAEFLKGE